MNMDAPDRVAFMFLIFIGFISVCYHIMVTNRLPTNNDKYFQTYSGFSNVQIRQQISNEIQTVRTYRITAVLLHWKRLATIKKLIHDLSRTNLFEEILVWNNNPNVNLSIKDFANESSIHIDIINSKINLKDRAKYQVCAATKTTACFYVDDDWDPIPYIHSLVSSFYSEPKVLHLATNAHTYYTNILWSFFDRTIDLHNGFGWIGCGSIFLREYAERHLKLLDQYLPNADSGTRFLCNSKMNVIILNQLFSVSWFC